MLKSLRVLLPGDAVVPMTSQHGQSSDCDKYADYQTSEYPRRDGLGPLRTPEVERVLDRTGIDALEAGRAFIAPHAAHFVNFDRGRTGLRTELAIDAGGFLACNFQRAQYAQETEKSSVRAEESAPEVADDS